MSRVAKRFKIFKTIEKSFDLIFKHPALLGLFLLPFLLSVVFMLVGFAFLRISITDLSLSANTIIALVFVMLPWVWIIMVGVAAQIVAVEKIQRRKRFTFLSALSEGFRKSGRLFVAYVSEEIFIMLGLILFIVPGIYIAVRLSLVVPACVMEKKGLGIRKSWKTTKGNFWKLLGFIGIWSLAFLVFGIVPLLFLVSLILIPAYLTSLGLVYLKLKKN